MPEEYTSLSSRLQAIEYRLERVEDQLVNDAIPHALTAAEVGRLRQDFAEIKTDIAAQLKDFTNKTWKLIFALLIIMAALMGIKSIPYEQILGGG